METEIKHLRKSRCFFGVVEQMYLLEKKLRDKWKASLTSKRRPVTLNVKLACHSEVIASEKQTRRNKKGTRHHASGTGKHSRSVQADHRFLGKRKIQSVHTIGL